jgi:NAD-reducing hydrogenase small subunit
MSAGGETRKVRVATTSLAGCFGCHTSFLDIDERLFSLLEKVEFDRSPLTDIKHCGPCDIGLVEGGICNAENVHVLREFRRQCRILIAVGACAINGELPLPLDKVHPLHEVVKVDYFIPGCPPPAEAIWKVLSDLLAGRTPKLGHGLMHYD